ncbi:MAG: tetratricopeptide repeat protein [Pyrinomonadaceae bacterium]
MKRIRSRYLSTLSFLAAFTLFLVIIGTGCSPDATQDISKLAIGKPVTRSIVNQEVHSYSVHLEKETYVLLAVKQNDVDVITEVVGPGEKALGEFDTPTSGRGTENIRIGADITGEYRVDIYTLSERAEPGEYTLEVADLRPMNARDAKALSAVRLHQEADRLRANADTRKDSIPVYEKALQIWRDLGEPAEEANTLRAMGFAYQRLEDLEKAEEHFGKSLEIWASTGDLRSAAFTHVIFGVISKKRGDLQKGLEHDLMAQSLWEQAEDMPEYTQNLVRIGNDHIKLKNNGEALGYFQKALDSSKLTGRKSIEAYVLSECGNAQTTIGNQSEALNFYRRSLEIWKTLKQEKAVAGLEEKINKLSAS